MDVIVIVRGEVILILSIGWRDQLGHRRRTIRLLVEQT